ncbi:MAG: hypothetical protein LBS43_10845 [Prevotellaceae bacterium]|jgi:hypothetical protein|nr:hypothetical protein [Prevotellaceae bacterium]
MKTTKTIMRYKQYRNMGCGIIGSGAFNKQWSKVIDFLKLPATVAA